jgi:hypothetical protein
MSGEANKSADNKTRSEKMGEPRMSHNLISQSETAHGFAACSQPLSCSVRARHGFRSRPFKQEGRKEIAKPATVSPLRPLRRRRGAPRSWRAAVSGTQGYVCLPLGPGAASGPSTLLAPRPHSSLSL